MTFDITRARALMIWFAGVVLLAGIWMAFGARPDAGAIAMLIAFSLVPAGVLMLLWPGAQALTARDVLHGTRKP